MATTSTLRELWDTTRMRLLVEIERQGSVSAAAAAIGIGQPSASQHLRLLEAAAGQRLVERSGRGSTVTEARQGLAARRGGGRPRPRPPPRAGAVPRGRDRGGGDARPGAAAKRPPRGGPPRRVHAPIARAR